MYPTTPSAHLCTRTPNDHRRRKGLNDENYLSPASREKCFLLTLPFIEPAHIIFTDRDEFLDQSARILLDLRLDSAMAVTDEDILF
jgi:hypothetical protein